MPIINLSSKHLWKAIEENLDPSEEHICALPMRTIVKPVRVITLLQTDTMVSKTPTDCPGKEIDVSESTDEQAPAEPAAEPPDYGLPSVNPMPEAPPAPPPPPDNV